MSEHLPSICSLTLPWSVFSIPVGQGNNYTQLETRNEFFCKNCCCPFSSSLPSEQTYFSDNVIPYKALQSSLWIRGFLTVFLWAMTYGVEINLFPLWMSLWKLAPTFRSILMVRGERPALLEDGAVSKARAAPDSGRGFLLQDVFRHA